MAMPRVAGDDEPLKLWVKGGARLLTTQEKRGFSCVVVSRQKSTN